MASNGIQSDSLNIESSESHQSHGVFYGQIGKYTWKESFYLFNDSAFIAHMVLSRMMMCLVNNKLERMQKEVAVAFK
jgi:hypothetical protein